jgi:hypothetical protein
VWHREEHRFFRNFGRQSSGGEPDQNDGRKHRDHKAPARASPLAYCHSQRRRAVKIRRLAAHRPASVALNTYWKKEEVELAARGTALAVPWA